MAEEEQTTSFEAQEQWTGSKEGWYFGTGAQGLGYYKDTEKPVVKKEEKEEVEVTEEALKAVSAGFVRVNDCLKADEKEKKEKPKLSKKEMKRLAKLTPEQRVLLGHGDLFKDEKALKVHNHAPSSSKEFADLDPDVVRTIESQKQKAVSDPTAKERYSYQKKNPHFGESNIQRQDIYLLYKEEKIRKRKLENQEEKMRSVTTRQNKPSWL
eukprot:TRINITY_DN12612_c0_g1_i2.p1 TRINITY_DN12612_c0_g1~~TRINITY_DN12612_c0_g1_i2.p1  ORF type:complete len:211 (+),score=65.16 TRINITY_DN12612_c0_g1_i2:51-683(+)